MALSTKQKVWTAVAVIALAVTVGLATLALRRMYRWRGERRIHRIERLEQRLSAPAANRVIAAARRLLQAELAVRRGLPDRARQIYHQLIEQGGPATARVRQHLDALKTTASRLAEKVLPPADGEIR